jgi:hypothetical protein
LAGSACWLFGIAVSSTLHLYDLSKLPRFT